MMIVFNEVCFIIQFLLKIKSTEFSYELKIYLIAKISLRVSFENQHVKDHKILRLNVLGETKCLSLCLSPLPPTTYELFINQIFLKENNVCCWLIARSRPSGDDLENQRAREWFHAFLVNSINFCWHLGWLIFTTSFPEIKTRLRGVCGKFCQRLFADGIKLHWRKHERRPHQIRSHQQLF